METLTLSDETEIFGMAYLNPTIYLLSSEWIYAHEYPNLKTRSYHGIDIREIKGPCDIAACQKEQCLYISDHKERCIWRIQINDYVQRPIKWLTDIEEPFTLSVSSGGCLLIGLPKSSPDHCIKCYNRRGRKLAEWVMR